MRVRLAWVSQALWLVSAIACASGSGGEMDDIVTTAIGPYQIRATSEAIASSDSVYATVGEAWGVLPEVYEVLGIPDVVIDVRNKRLGNAEFQPRRIGGSRLSRFLDCGSSIGVPAYADSYDVTMSLITRVTEGGDGVAVVQTQIHAVAKSRDVRGDPILCSSRGTLENRIVEMVVEMVRPG